MPKFYAAGLFFNAKIFVNFFCKQHHFLQKQKRALWVQIFTNAVFLTTFPEAPFAMSALSCFFQRVNSKYALLANK